MITLPSLPFEKNALEPYISATTLEFHYGKHHQAYVDNFNKLSAGTEFENMPLEEVIKKATGGIFNNGAQVWNHTFYWNCLNKPDTTKPSDKLLKAIEDQFGSLDNFKEQFSNAAVTLFGSGWAWLCKDEFGKLHINQTSNADNPIKNGLTPILTIDVWEHAYYLDKQNRRPDYVKDFWHILNWDFVNKLF